MKTISAIILSFILLSGIAFFQYTSDAHIVHAAERPLTLPPSPILKMVDLGLHSALAGLIWLNTIQEVGGLRGPYKSFPEDIRVINALDPKFSYPYAFATLIMPEIAPDRINDAILIGHEGILHAAPDWRIPYYLAVNYHTILKDRSNAAHYLAIAADIKDAPKNIIFVAANYGAWNADAREQTKQIWISLHDNAGDDVVRERAKNYITHIEILQFLDRAVEAYRKETGSYPRDIDNLVSKKILKEIPRDPFGLEFIINEKGRVESR